MMEAAEGVCVCTDTHVVTRAGHSARDVFKKTRQESQNKFKTSESICEGREPRTEPSHSRNTLQLIVQFTAA